VAVAPTNALADFAASLRFDALPGDVVANLKWMILDSLGCALAATALGDGCRQTLAVMGDLGGKPESTILGLTTKVSAPNAAFANGALIHALNYDPIGSDIGHVGVVCLAGPLAVAEAKGGVSGRDLLVASAVACEVSARVTAAIAHTGRRPSDKFLSGQLLSYFGAAAGAGRILGLDARKMASCFGLALMQMAGSRQMVLSGDPPAKGIYGAFPNQAGVLAALLSHEGLGAECDVVGGPAGLYPMIYGGVYDVATLTQGLGTRFLLNEVEFKPWPTSNHVHAFVEAGCHIFAAGFDHAAIASVEIVAQSALRPWCEPLERRRRPDNSAAAANSIPFCVAKALVHGDVRLGDVTSAGLQDKAAIAVAQRTTCRFDDALKGAIVNIVMRDGRRHQAGVERPLGHRTRPISYERLVEKFRDCCSHALVRLASRDLERLIAVIDQLDRLDDVRTITALASGTGGSA
jgi:2-methylcitrate dehydratase PrpD